MRAAPAATGGSEGNAAWRAPCRSRPSPHETGELVSGGIRTRAATAPASLRACLTAVGASLEAVLNGRVTAPTARFNEVYAAFFGLRRVRPRSDPRVRGRSNEAAAPAKPQL
ncbi:hypothetical protein [Streptomyces sp. NPDC002088]|uniref:hypothetical protein n=1 Tax=Streptomyces sp. NPDC002088 TaxID=3154665 RepID=UPI00331A3C5E